jgi:hypothetical protein
MQVRGNIRGRGAAIACLAVVLAAPQAASASRAALTYEGPGYGYEFYYEGSPGESNVVTHRAFGGSPGEADAITVTDTGATIEYDPVACTANGPHEVTCASFNPASQGLDFANRAAACAASQVSQPGASCIPDLDDEGFQRARFMLGDGDNRYESSAGTVPIGVTVIGADGDNAFSVRGELWTSLGTGDGDDDLRVGPLAGLLPGTAWGSVEAGGGADRIDVRNGQAGDRVRCGDGPDPAPKIDSGDQLQPEHGCERVPPGAILVP